MKRSPFRSKLPARRPARQWEGGPVTSRTAAVRVTDHSARLVVPLRKSEPLQHLGYQALVRKLHCARCKTLSLPRQFCHRDEGKGMAIKTDCREGWPGCAECHWVVGTSGALGKEGRRAFELGAGANTRAQILALGLWPKRLPLWVETV